MLSRLCVLQRLIDLCYLVGRVGVWWLWVVLLGVRGGWWVGGGVMGGGDEEVVQGVGRFPWET